MLADWLMLRTSAALCGARLPWPALSAAPTCINTMLSSIFTSHGIGCVTASRDPLRHSEDESEDRTALFKSPVYDRVTKAEPSCIKSCPTGGLHFGSKYDMNVPCGRTRKQLPRAVQLSARRRPTIRRALAATASFTGYMTPRSRNLRRAAHDPHLPGP